MSSATTDSSNMSLDTSTGSPTTSPDLTEEQLLTVFRVLSGWKKVTWQMCNTWKIPPKGWSADPGKVNNALDGNLRIIEDVAALVAISSNDLAAELKQLKEDGFIDAIRDRRYEIAWKHEWVREKLRRMRQAAKKAAKQAAAQLAVTSQPALTPLTPQTPAVPPTIQPARAPQVAQSTPSHLATQSQSAPRPPTASYKTEKSDTETALSSVKIESASSGQQSKLSIGETPADRKLGAEEASQTEDDGYRLFFTDNENSSTEGGEDTENNEACDYTKGSPIVRDDARKFGARATKTEESSLAPSNRKHRRQDNARQLTPAYSDLSRTVPLKRRREDTETTIRSTYGIPPMSTPRKRRLGAMGSKSHSAHSTRGDDAESSKHSTRRSALDIAKGILQNVPPAASIRDSAGSKSEQKAKGH
jgi:hypothetical protein